MKKILSSILSLIIVFSIVSCGKDTADKTTDAPSANGPSSSHSDSDASGDENGIELKLSENGNVNAVIIYPEGANSLEQVANKLQMDILKKFDLYVECKEDSAVEYVESAVEILIGKTNRPESASAHEQLLGPSDYICGLYGNKIVITGMNSVAITSGYGYFISRSILSANPDDDFAYNSKNDLYFEGTAGCPIKTCAGNSLENYKIVFPKDSIKGEYYVATSLKHHLYYKVGLDLEIIDDSTPASGYEIIIGQTNRGLTPSIDKGNYEISVKEGNLCISAYDLYGYEEAFKFLSKELFVKKIEADILGADYVHAAKCKSVPTSNSEYRIMFNNCWGLCDYKEHFIDNRDENAAAMYLAFDADVIGINEYWPVMRESGAIKTLLEKNGYKEVEIPDYNRAKGNVMPVFYKESSVKVIYSTYTHYQWYANDSAYKSGTLTTADDSKGVTTVVFESLKTGERFIVSNTHFSSNYNVSNEVGTINRKIHIDTALGEINKVIELYPDIPVFLGCDYNATVSSEECKKLFDAQFKDCHEEATTVRGSDGASCHGAPTYVPELELFIPGPYSLGSNYKASIDHIFVLDSKNTVSVDVYETVLTDQAASFSDHAPVVVEFNLGQK
ncbi:MAG: hypothetical protein E7607_03645 [Ruminococcaceae bacterium]|nr:hypothetical protein [Oscillospiraceae bacterium]